MTVSNTLPDTEEWSNKPPKFVLDDGARWITPFVAQCNVDPKHFWGVLENLLRNPNVISSLLFRAEILYDSETDASVISPDAYQSPPEEHEARSGRFSDLTRHLQADIRPRLLPTRIPNMKWQRTVVRRLVPRNPKLDKSLLQTCHSFISPSALGGSATDEETNHLVLQIPHADKAEDVPFYHPAVACVSFLYSVPAEKEVSGSLSVTYRLFPFPDGTPLPKRLERTALHLVQITRKHMVGREGGYEKRVHHDQMVPQARLQDTYTRLKLEYAESFISAWKEDTDPAKHVFEDLGIAAFLIELWGDMYSNKEDGFPGFVDIGCGNGLLVDILNREGYRGWGFDVRRRKSWANIAHERRSTVQEMILFPAVFPCVQDRDIYSVDGDDRKSRNEPRLHNGLFPENTFIISNHADELTVWTPILAYLSNCTFIAIPCCSHDFSGAKFRARETLRSGPQTAKAFLDPPIKMGHDEARESGSLKKAAGQASAYSTLCSYVKLVALEMGFTPEVEVLRIPSTRNTAIIGRTNRHPKEELFEAKIERILKLIQLEMDSPALQIQNSWKSAVERLTTAKKH